MTKPPRVLVLWRDTESDSTWQPRATVERAEPPLCESLGFLLVCNSKKLVLAHTITHGADSVSDRTTIPRGCVETIRRVKSAGVVVLNQRKEG